jgi:putative SOS response-associated peptidase YedK
MFGRVRLDSDYSEIKIRLKFVPDAPAPNYEADYKPPTKPMLVAMRSVDGRRVPQMMKWGQIPHWAEDSKLQYSTFNTRSQEFTTKAAYAWRRGQRCLVVSGRSTGLRNRHGQQRRDGDGGPLVELARPG